MATVIYLPVATPEARALAAAWNQGRTAKNKAACTVIERPNGLMPSMLRRLTTRVLSEVGANDKLYVLSHGAVAGPGLNQPALEIGMDRGAKLTKGLQPHWEGGKWKGYTPQGLAAHLEAEGLTKQIADLRLFACGTGVAKANIPVFAKELKQELVTRGYARVTVTGYLGEVSTTYLNRKWDSSNTKHIEHPDPGMVRLTATRHKGVKDANDDMVPASIRKVMF